MTRERLEGAVCLLAFVLTVPAANWMIGNLGTTCVPNGPCLIPVGPGLMAPSGVVMASLALILRDLVQRRLGAGAGLVAIGLGGALSLLLAPAAIVLASTAAFVVSELADFAVYTPLQRRRFVLAVVASTAVGLVIDSAIFLQLAFGSQQHLVGQVVGKSWMVLAAIPFLVWLRRYDERRGLVPA